MASKKLYILELDNNQHISFWLDKSLLAMAILGHNEKGTNKGHD